ncbi:MAG: hypothetical protein IPG02_13965 [Ignavibacteria bacterium]|nr:hypothetical protein [Ignavibacteria bacterium]
MAIHESKLIVTINTTIINKDNLENVIDKYFSNEFESGNATEFETWNPKPYYRAVKYSNSNDQYRFFADDLDILEK